MTKKRMKFLSIILLIFLGFFIKVNDVKAVATPKDIGGEYVCEYRLWHSGIYPKLNKFLYNDSTYDYSTIPWLKYNDGDLPDLHKINTQLNDDGYYIVYTSLKKGTEYYVSSWRSGNQGLQTGQHLSEDYESCPKYIKITNDKTSATNSYELKTATKAEYEKFLSNYYFYSGNYLNQYATDPNDGAILNASSKNVDPPYFNYYNSDDGGFYVPDFGYTGTMIFALYDDKYISADKLKKIREETINEYVSITVDGWNTIINNQEKKMTNACGAEWKKFVDRSKYYDDLKGCQAANCFVNALISNASFNYDFVNNVSSECINQRKNWIKMWSTLYDFYTTIYDDERLFATLKIYDSQKHQSKVLNTIDVYMTLVIQGSSGSEEKLDIYKDQGSKENAERYEKLLKLQEVRNSINGDFCGVIICTETQDKYLELQKSTAAYTACTKIYNNLCSCDTCDTSSNKYNSNACTQCKKRCESTTKQNLFDEQAKNDPILSKGQYSTYNSIETARKNCVKNLNSQIDSIKAAIKNYETELSTVAFTRPDDLDVDFGGQYTFKCDDVELFHTIYMIIVILAPILTIIMGSIDYFKVMLSSDEEKMSKFKKKLPKRLIMLVLLMLVPMIVSFITSNVAGLDNSLLGYIVNGC